eukprot:PLAT556.1.p1 GENE.PLAT556.1~~PLAT556.1.p1  ORF type:complete len:227 (+),score=105.65 PLAT556.1:32-682(+)
MAEGRDTTVLALFDVDGTLSPARKTASAEMMAAVAALRKRIVVGVVGGSDLAKQRHQLGDDVTDAVDYSFSENGLVAFKDGEEIGRTSIADELGEERLKALVDFCLAYIAELDLPIKRGTFVEFRTGMLNVSPIGRNCSYEERLAFNAYDEEHGVRKAFVAALEEKFAAFELQFSIGGQISFDVFPKGWDKTYCLRYVEEFDTVHFFWRQNGAWRQ